MVENQGQIGPEHKFSKEKLTTLMALYHFENFDDALETVAAIYNTGGKGAFLRYLQPQR
jgi:sulfoacetaldehyde dehydrogenase